MDLNGIQNQMILCYIQAKAKYILLQNLRYFVYFLHCCQYLDLS